MTYSCGVCDLISNGSIGLAYSLNSDNTYTVTGLGDCTDECVFIPAYVDGKKVTGIAENAFSESTVKYIGIPYTIKTIGTRAFYGCTGLTEITIPESVTSIGTQIFYKASNLATVYYNSTYVSSDYNQFLNLSHVTKIVFGGSYVPSCAIRGNASVKVVEILDTATKVNSYAFYNCSNLTSIEIPDSVTNIGVGAFYNCTSLTSIEIPDGVTSIGYGAFAYCTSLTSIEIPDSVTSIGECAFAYCTSLTSIEIPNSVTSIGYGAFGYCTSLTSINYRGTEEQWNAITKGSSWDSDTGNYTITYNYGKPIYTEGLKFELQSDDTYAVTGYTGTDTDVVIPVTYEGKAVTSIVQRAFYENVDITNVSIPDSITIIGDYAFYGCTSIESITIPESVTYIGPKAINSCKEIVWNFSGFSKWEVYIPSIVGKDPYESYQTKTLTNLRLIITIASDPAYVNYANKCLRNTVTVDSGVDYNVAGHDYRITLCYGNYALTRVS